ncbi:Protein export cytoplasm protein SecA ATPase RNA helicase [Mycoplasmopsis meleagridis]|uniref:Protein translocase subunit SecA n=1 Tax=Mycoplasmopsis meleagridis ATCC 25294 TaxID=1264554 RepID=A0A0F5H1A8_9BACT|nr:preprotein translocase subunit SecA [Mycoplasmopsis meleagridis]KKB27091.1 Protein export cytoplasm protein SecA ATPase RNA helicase [Mycoplasmopsis meleagridis ATCC 25294]KUH47179.1 preprotein translocase subunit SecA [Mycoplasmopsis meleagridis]OAD18305.1 Protein export cytoplasm protein SecA ATPase RNA helicase [Mycoplasmopsis meleagridis]VEU77393.1 preprotein translocase subunit SecA [Mycoplasmopsis meleagridis]
MNLFNIKSTEMRIAEKTLKKINHYEPLISKLNDSELKAKTDQFKARIANGEALDLIRAEAFAVAREATKRVLGKRPYDVQMIGGVLLDLSSVAEMKTGEGKTITSIAPVYLNALVGKGAIVSTVNEYLSERDALEMGQVFNFLGLSVGINKAQMNVNLKREAYACDITYSVHSELGFDYLRDNMVNSIEQKVQRGLHFCLIDEADSILIDEAKTPLIISGGDTEDNYLYYSADQYVRTLGPEDYEIDEESKAISLTYSGINKANNFFTIDNLYDIENSEIVHRIQNALRAHKVMKNNVEYIVRDGKIELVDAFTGRIMEGRAYSEGLQQALQAKEMVQIEPETKTLATITYQNFFRMFNKLCGMTGTAKTEEQEFIDIYNMRVNPVPTNKPVIRKDLPDSIYGNYEAKWIAVSNKVEKLYKKGQPVLIGTAQIEDSEILHHFLNKRNIPHTVLNAKQNASEAEIISAAGQVGAVTIATNMAGRGTDIKPSKEALELGGLYVIGTDRAESRRIDNQLRGRSGRQGDPGVSKFYVSLDDQLMQRFSNYEEFKKSYEKQGNKEITNKNLQFGFKHAQKKIEGFNYDSRKSVLHYDDVIRQQRDLFYAQRDLILISDNVSFILRKMIKNIAKNVVKYQSLKLKSGHIDSQKLVDFINENFSNRGEDKNNLLIEKVRKIHDNDLVEYLSNHLTKNFNEWEENAMANSDQDTVLEVEKSNLLSIVDKYWQNHIDAMDKLRSNINLVQYSQKNPYQMYTEEGTKTFYQMLNNIAFDTIKTIMADSLGRKSNITKEMREDPLFEQLRSLLILNDFNTIEEQEKYLIDTYNNLKNVNFDKVLDKENKEKS